MYTVVKTIKGRQYLYLQRSWREGGRVRTRSIYLGTVNGSGKRKGGGFGGLLGLLRANKLSPEERALASAERAAARVEQEQRARFGETAQERADREHRQKLDELHERYGLRIGPSNPTPVDPEARTVSALATDQPVDPGLGPTNGEDPASAAAEGMVDQQNL